jgi:hypothetical protein
VSQGSEDSLKERLNVTRNRKQRVEVLHRSTSVLVRDALPCFIVISREGDVKRDSSGKSRNQLTPHMYMHTHVYLYVRVVRCTPIWRTNILEIFSLLALIFISSANFVSGIFKFISS